MHLQTQRYFTILTCNQLRIRNHPYRTGRRRAQQRRAQTEGGQEEEQTAWYCDVVVFIHSLTYIANCCLDAEKWRENSTRTFLESLFHKKLVSYPPAGRAEARRLRRCAARSSRARRWRRGPEYGNYSPRLYSSVMVSSPSNISGKNDSPMSLDML